MRRWTRFVVILLLAAASGAPAFSASISSGARAFQASGTPKAAFDDLLAADRAFSAASAKTDLLIGLSAMFADGVVIPMPPEQFVEGKKAVVDALRANGDNLTARTDWTPAGGGVSADGRHGFTFGYMTIHRADGTDLPLKYLAYWVKGRDGWRVAVYKRSRANAAPASLAPVAAALPEKIVAPTTDAATIERARRSLDAAERAFSSEAQRIGLGPAFVQFGSADSINLGRPDDVTVVTGSDTIGRMVGEGSGTGVSPVSWAPERVIVASSGDLGVTIGWITPNSADSSRPPRNPFFTVWRRENPGAAWKYIAE
jgi:ketosteroid isomerase-like protein